MGRVIQPLLFLLARCTRNQLIRQIEFLKAENEMLRTRINKQMIYVRPEERRRLLELGKALGPAVEHLLTIVSYHTFLRWLRQERRQAPVRQIGRPPKPDEVRALVLKIAEETGWGYTRILGELRKLGVHVSRQTVVNILKANHLEPGPRQGPGTWDEFLKRHAETLWQCDFFSRRTLTRLGFTQIYALVFLNVATRRVWISPSTLKPSPAWVADQAATFLEHAGKDGTPAVELVTRDNDKVFNSLFDAVLGQQGVKVRKLAVRAPNTNAFVERFIQAIQVECLDHFFLFGEKE